MDVVLESDFEARILSKQTFEKLARRISITGVMLWMVVAALLPAATAGAQSRYLESVDLLFRNFSMTNTNIEDRLAGDFLDTLIRLDAGQLERHTVTGAWAEAAAGAPEGEANSIYAAANTGSVEVDASPIGYKADTTGFSAGYERWMGSTLLALNLASTKAEVDFSGSGFDDNREDQEMLSAGMHTMGIYYDNWIWRGRIAGFMARHDYRDATEFDSSGINAGTAIGRLFKFGEQWGVLLPEIGGEYLYTERESFVIGDESAPSGVVEYFSDQQLTGVASLRWTTRTHLLGIDMVPSLTAGVRMLLAGDEIEEARTIGDVPMLLQKKLDKTTPTLSASLLLHVATHHQAVLAYDGGYGDGSSQHLLSFRWRVTF